MSNQERVARAVRDAFFPNHVVSVDDIHRAAAVAAIDALADVEGIADALVNSMLDDPILNQMTKRQFRTLAAAVVAWMKDQA